MKRFVHILALLLLLMMSGCLREPFENPTLLPDGTPVTLSMSFGAPEMPILNIGTRAEATPVDEAHVHDLYVFIFRPVPDPDDASKTVYAKLYGRYFSYEHQVSKSELNASENECWFVENQTITGVTPAYSKTRGAVKISTSSYPNCIVVLLANVSNTLTLLDDEEPVVRLNQIDSLSQLQRVKVKLTQDVVVRKDYFLMMGLTEGVNTGTMQWNEGSTTNYSSDPKNNLPLTRVDAKVKFRIKADKINISKVNPRYWQVCKAPSGCYLFDVEHGGIDTNEDPTVFDYFDTEETFFDGTEVDASGDTCQVFCFYMLENRLTPIRSAEKYSRREEQVKEADPEHEGYVKNGKWRYANENSTYVRFDVILTLEKVAIEHIDPDANHAMTTDVAFTVHLGNFVNSDRDGTAGVSTNFDDYNTLRGNSYTYNVTIKNSTSIYTEVMLGNEIDPAQEGFLLLVKDGIVNCDAHYEYRSVTFKYRNNLNPNKFSWYVKTPFNEGGALTREVDAAKGIYYYPAPDSIVDYQWVLFAVNEKEGSVYSQNRKQFPGLSAYHPAWKLDPDHLADSLAACPRLLDISQLISYIFYNQKLFADSDPASIFDTDSLVRITAFVNEYYYETNPETGDIDPQLWRQFVNAKPREMHILSDAESSLDRKSDVISSSQSIIQQSIQTIYNIYAPELYSIWGTEHKDEMREMAGEYGWGFGTPVETSGTNNDDNGRNNTAIMWGANKTPKPEWTDFVNYLVPNDMPELLADKQGMAYSCMTRNRDNNGNGDIDPDEVRWYLASINQLIGMYIGGDALSQTARLYQPFPGQWRAHVVSSSNGSNPKVLTSEEGIAYYNANDNWMGFTDQSAQGGPTINEQKNRIRSVRCIRNVGTYEQGGSRKDISEAPLSRVPDRYYTVDTTGTGADAYYTFLFNRLDPKALRPLSTGELPYHNEHSAHNKVYLQMVTQSKNQAISVPSDVEMVDINPIITAAGSNPYCPAGYRVPNQVELSLMTTVLKNKSYFESSLCAVSRTYYSRGNYAAPGEQVSSEAGKTGFGYNGTKLFCVNNHHTQDLYIRCVKDNDLTGTIMGDMLVPQDSICPGERMRLEFKFSSSASSLYYASLKLRYTVEGVNKEKEILLDKEPSGVQYIHSQEITVPTLAALGIASIPDEGIEMTFRFEVRNAGGQSKVVEKTVRMVSTHLSASMKILPGWKDGSGFPVYVNATSLSRRYTINSVLVRQQVGTGAWTETEKIGDTHPRYFRDTVYVYPTIKPAAPPATQGDSITVQVVITCSDGSTSTWQGSMQILRAGYTPNGTSDKWTDTATGLDFSRGDFIEARIQPTTDASVAKRGLLSIGNNINDWNVGAGKACIHTYFPGATANQFKLRLAARYGANSGSSSSDIGSDHSGSPITLNFSSRDSLMIDNSRYTGWRAASYNDFWSTMFAQTTMYVGQQEGSNRSNSTYDYVRVVHQAEKCTPAP